MGVVIMTHIIQSLAPIRIGSTVLATDNLVLSLGAIEEASIHSGLLYPTARLVKGSNPRATFRAPFAAAYTLLGLGGYVANTLDIYLARYSAQVKSTASNHVKLALSTSASALVTITGVSVEQDGVLWADIACDFVSSNGITHPLVKTDDNDLATLSSQPVLHTNGPAKLANTIIDGVRGWSLDLQQQVDTIRTDGDLYPNAVVYRGAKPQLTVTFTDPTTLLGLSGMLGSEASTSTVVYAKQYSQATGEVIGGATAASLTIADGYINPDQLSAAIQGVATQSVTLYASNAASDTHPITVSLSATAP